MQVKLEVDGKEIEALAHTGRMGAYWSGEIHKAPNLSRDDKGIVQVNIYDGSKHICGKYRYYCWTTDDNGDPLFRVCDRLT